LDCYDIAITSCKHTYHPFCLIEVLRDNNKCLICDELSHLDWWTNWGFCVPNEDLKNLTNDLGLNELWRSMVKCLLDASTSLIPHGMCLFGFFHIFLPSN
jgi:hypothetical protein